MVLNTYDLEQKRGWEVLTSLDPPPPQLDSLMVYLMPPIQKSQVYVSILHFLQPLNSSVCYHACPLVCHWVEKVTTLCSCTIICKQTWLAFCVHGSKHCEHAAASGFQWCEHGMQTLFASDSACLQWCKKRASNELRTRFEQKFACGKLARACHELAASMLHACSELTNYFSGSWTVSMLRA